jgi:hypothetical protein
MITPFKEAEQHVLAFGELHPLTQEGVLVDTPSITRAFGTVRRFESIVEAATRLVSLAIEQNPKSRPEKARQFATPRREAELLALQGMLRIRYEHPDVPGMNLAFLRSYASLSTIELTNNPEERIAPTRRILHEHAGILGELALDPPDNAPKQAPEIYKLQSDTLLSLGKFLIPFTDQKTRYTDEQIAELRSFDPTRIFISQKTID